MLYLIMADICSECIYLYLIGVSQGGDLFKNVYIKFKIMLHTSKTSDQQFDYGICIQLIIK